MTIRLGRGLISSDCQFRNRRARVRGPPHRPSHRTRDANQRACPHADGPLGACSTRALRLQDRSRTQMPARRPTVRWRMQKQSLRFSRFSSVVWGKMNLLRARLVTQTRVTLKSSTHHKIRPFVHANVMGVLMSQRKYWQSTIHRAPLDEMITFAPRRHSRTTNLPCDRRVWRGHRGQFFIHLSDRADQ